ncbi:ATP-dependent helicase [Desulfosarcina widdelii]|uniref:ATP-dependent helicase n=1 Tax=Desulfosarcina widdelii TaxID=947919 RepID=A0A5K7YWU6_9BACT|nr:ATP-dependent DNA helicase [Desulfosarcina widdelii]BBO72865.1 ATP-dependent helicase [Desulfosarcina widdelii]
MKKQRHPIAVTTLVTSVLRSGDLDVRFSSPGRSLDGIRIHRDIQRRRPEGYRAEVPVFLEVETEDLVLAVGGRVDGVFEEEGGTVVEEIKSTTRELVDLEDRSDPCHWGQAKAYAYLLACERKLEEVGVRLTYCNVDSKETLEREETFARDELESFFRDLVDGYLAWATTQVRWRKLRNTTIGELDFPFASYRSGQRTMAVAVYRTLRDGGQALIQAATGIGKTMAALFPAIKTIGNGDTDRIFFLTARNTGKTAAISALNLLQEKGLRLKRVCLTAKDHICFCPDAACSPDLCEYAKGHFDRLPDALQDAFAYDNLDRATIEAVARDREVCPFELSLELACWADCIVCDYNYAFDPRVYLRRFFDEESGAYAFLVDEAHNLVDRSREMFSARLNKSAFLELRQAVKSGLPAVYRAAGKINTWMLAARKQAVACGGFQSDPHPPDGLEPLLRVFQRVSERWLAKNRPAPWRELLLEIYFEAGAFCRVLECYDNSYVSCYTAAGKNLEVKLFCLDPSSQLKAALQRGRGAVFFSATLTPPGYFQEIFGCSDSAAKLGIGSPFPRDNLQVLVADGISTLFTQREKSVEPIAELIRTFAAGKKGNYLCFFPSYAYMTMVVERFEMLEKRVRVAIQSPEMDDAERDRFLDRFSEQNRDTLVGFAVMGGVFGEGVDLVGERLSGAVIVGVGLPAICPERDLIRRHFDEKDTGFDYAYRYPGINRVLQAAGRVIRTGRDRGCLLLVDRRFTDAGYRRLLPGHWSIRRVHCHGQLEERLKRFWATAKALHLL